MGAWQQRIGKEERMAALYLLGHHGRQAPRTRMFGDDPFDSDWVAPMHDMHRTFSSPGMLPRIDTASDWPSRAPSSYGQMRGKSGGAPLTAATLSTRPSQKTSVSRSSIRSATAQAVSAAMQDLQQEPSPAFAKTSS